MQTKNDTTQHCSTALADPAKAERTAAYSVVLLSPELLLSSPLT